MESISWNADLEWEVQKTSNKEFLRFVLPGDVSPLNPWDPFEDLLTNSTKDRLLNWRKLERESSILYFSKVVSLLRYNSNTTRVTLYKWTGQWPFSMFTELCNHHQYQISEHFNHPQRNLAPLSGRARPPSSPPRDLSAATDLLSVSKDFLSLSIYLFIFYWLVY